MFLKNTLLETGRESYACCSTPLEIAVLWGVLHLYERNLEKKSDQSSATLHFSKMQFCCKRPSETVLLLCRAATLLTDFSSVLGSSSSSRLIRQRGVRAEQMIILVCLQVAVSGFSLESTRLQERVFSRDSKDLFAVVGLEQIQKHPLLVIKTRLKMWILIF